MNKWTIKFLNENNEVENVESHESFKECIDEINLYRMSLENKTTTVIIVNECGVIHFRMTVY